MKENLKRTNKVNFWHIALISFIMIFVIAIVVNIRALATDEESGGTEEASSNVTYVTTSDGYNIPVPDGFSASEVGGETNGATGFVIYEGDIDWNTVLSDEEVTDWDAVIYGSTASVSATAQEAQSIEETSNDASTVSTDESEIALLSDDGSSTVANAETDGTNTENGSNNEEKVSSETGENTEENTDEQIEKEQEEINASEEIENAEKTDEETIGIEEETQSEDSSESENTESIDSDIQSDTQNEQTEGTEENVTNENENQEKIEDETSSESNDGISLASDEGISVASTGDTLTQKEINILNLQTKVNQYVWVPVETPSRIYGVDSSGKLWGKLYNSWSSSSTATRDKYNWSETDEKISITSLNRNREPDVTISNMGYDIDSKLNSYLDGDTKYELLSEELEQNFIKIMQSIEKYGGFYIGRYETGGLSSSNSNTAVVRKMDTSISSVTWYVMYEQCKSLGYENDNVETSNGLAVAVNHISTVNLDTNGTNTQTGSDTYGTNATVVGYGLAGAYQWKYRFYPSTASTSSKLYNTEISDLELNSNGNILVAVEYSYILYGSYNEGSATTIVSTSPTSKVYDATVVELEDTGDYVQVYNNATVAGNYDDYISSVKAMSDGGILIGGWYYSTTGTDFDQDGSDDGVSGTYTSDGFIVKLDSDGEVEYSNRIYGDGYDSVTTVTELENGTMVAGGTTDSSVLYASTFEGDVNDDEDEDDGSSGVKILTQTGNSDGFIIAEVEGEVPKANYITVENTVKTFKITTRIANYETDEDFDGGDITGETDITVDDVSYTTTGTRYVETVEYLDNSKNEIVITAYGNYVVDYITINGVEYMAYTTTKDGDNTVVTLSIFEEVTEDIEVVVSFSNTISAIEVNHYLWTETDGPTTTKVADSESYTGTIGDKYETSPNTDIEYEIITNADYYSGWTNYDYYGDDLPEGLVATDSYEPDDPTLDYYIPLNATGTYVEGEIQVIDYYYKEKTYTLTVYHYLAGTEIGVPLKDGEEGETVPSEYQDGLAKNTPYETNQASEDKIDYSIYELVETPANSTGTIIENTVVIYYYQVKTVYIQITKVAEEDYTVVLGDTEFSLYYLVGESDDSLIDTDNVDEDTWSLFGIYTTTDLGILSLEDLPANYEYRLVETKASAGRMVSSGQWKIEITAGDEDDTSIITVDGVSLKITGIGDPLALVLTNEGELVLPNREYYTIPESGSLGKDIYYKIGICVVIVGFILSRFKFVTASKSSGNKTIKRRVRRPKR